jgi:sugar phosphate isomerase/epimerase
MKRRDAMRVIGSAIAAGGFCRARNTEAAGIAKTGLGVVIYALGLRSRWMKAEDPHHDLFEPFAFLDYCHGLGAGGIQVPLGIRDSQYASRLREKANTCGMFVEGILSPPQNDADLERFEAEIRTAAGVGARAVRTAMMPGRRYEQFKSLDEFRASAALGQRALERAAPVVERHRVRLAVENHKDQRFEERLKLLQHISSEYVGACVDTGNSFALLEEPLAVVEAYAPWAFSVHLKDQAVCESKDGFLLADVPFGGGFLDLKQMVAVLRRARPDIPFCLETITRDPLEVPCLSERFWVTFPEVPGSDLARTLRTVRAGAAGPLPRVSPLSLDEQAEVELANVKHCLEYARRELGL